MSSNKIQYAIVGTNIDEVKRLNSESGLSYNEIKQVLAQYYEQKKK
ncbi:hypothetical protein [Neobacillus mesonae]|nr:hypothetical protein [Neobacillus mesonae]MCM3568889.1 hypothetical protein [Neobacillus mesonae]